MYVFRGGTNSLFLLTFYLFLIEADNQRDNENHYNTEASLSVGEAGFEPELSHRVKQQYTIHESSFTDPKLWSYNRQSAFL